MKCIPRVIYAVVAVFSFIVIPAACSRAHEIAGSQKSRQSSSIHAQPTAARVSFAKARKTWTAAANAAQAVQNQYFMQAAAYLKKEPRIDTVTQQAIKKLTDLASIPVTGDSLSQMKRAGADVTALDEFFDTPNVRY